jgi:hypothetical protein
MEQYSLEQVSQIIKGYKLLDRKGALSSLLERIALCNNCALTYSSRNDYPINALVRPLPLAELSTEDQLVKYCKEIEREDSLLRTIFKKAANLDKIITQLGSCKFAIGLLPWLDRCMLFRRSEKTKLMIIGIDYKHFPPFYVRKSEHCFPLDNYQKQINTWGPTWKNFWKNLLDCPYDEDKVNDFIEENGVFMINSMLCFGGNDNPGKHFYGYLKCCRGHIKELIKIVRPEIVVSFGKFGCENVATLLHEQNINNSILGILSNPRIPFYKKIKAILSGYDYSEGIQLKYNSLPIVFWSLYQPARSHLNTYEGDYDVLRRLLCVKNGQRKLNEF